MIILLRLHRRGAHARDRSSKGMPDRLRMLAGQSSFDRTMESTAFQNHIEEMICCCLVTLSQPFAWRFRRLSYCRSRLSDYRNDQLGEGNERETFLYEGDSDIMKLDGDGNTYGDEQTMKRKD